MAKKRPPKPKPKTKLSIKQRAFLAAFEKCGQVTLAARAVGVVRVMHYEWLRESGERSDEYRAAFEESKDAACEALEAEARRRAVDGVNEPVIYKGELMGVWVNGRGDRVAPDAKGAKFIPLTVKKYSDMLLMAMLNANLPEKYRPRKDEPPKTEPERPVEQIEQEILDYLENNTTGEDDDDDGSLASV